MRWIQAIKCFLGRHPLKITFLAWHPYDDGLFLEVETTCTFCSERRRDLCIIGYTRLGGYHFIVAPKLPEEILGRILGKARSLRRRKAEGI